MKIVSIIICILVALALYFLLIGVLQNWLERKARDTKRAYKAESGEASEPDEPIRKEYFGKEHEWKPTFHLKHLGVRVFNLPFTPEKTEVFYLENEYDEKANTFIKQHKDYIKKLFASKGYSFVYLPDVKVSREEAEAMVVYHSPGDKTVEIKDSIVDGLQSDFLLDYMVFPENRKSIRSSFAWFGHSSDMFNHKKICYIFDYISFDADEAIANPKAVLSEILPELGESKTFIGGGLFSSGKVELEPSDEHFNDEDALDDESRKILDDVRSKLDKVRLRGISEAVIARYLKPTPKLSHMTITSDFRIILDDYDKMEIKMEPLVKTVYIFFLRHPEGVIFKDLSDHRNELEVIYRAIKAKHNNINSVY